MGANTREATNSCPWRAHESRRPAASRAVRLLLLAAAAAAVEFHYPESDRFHLFLVPRPEILELRVKLLYQGCLTYSKNHSAAASANPCADGSPCCPRTQPRRGTSAWCGLHSPSARRASPTSRYPVPFQGIGHAPRARSGLTVFDGSERRNRRPSQLTRPPATGLSPNRAAHSRDAPALRRRRQACRQSSACSTSSPTCRALLSRVVHCRRSVV